MAAPASSAFLRANPVFAGLPVYAPRVGRAPVPTLAQLSSSRWPRPRSPQYHRVRATRRRGDDVGPVSPHADRIGRAGRAVTDGNGFLFVGHRGTICPSGFLPWPPGNVRDDDLVDVSREHRLFRALRDPDRFGGRCGRCEHRHACGGSRARAWAVTGDPLAEDPGCAYEPGAWRPVPVISGGSDAVTAPISLAEVTAALRTVFDPELGMSIVDLGLVYDVEADRAGLPDPRRDARVGPRGRRARARRDRRRRHAHLRSALESRPHPPLSPDPGARTDRRRSFPNPTSRCTSSSPRPVDARLRTARRI